MRSFRRSLAPLLGLVFVAVSAAPAQAARVEVTHFGPIPCTVLCSYWDVPTALGYEECQAPFPEGSYDYSIFRLTSTTGTVHVSAVSPIDHDTFICTNTNPPVLVFAMANGATDTCDGIAGRDSLVSIGCLEEGDLTYNALLATNGGVNEMEFRVITYNWSDISSIDVVLEGPVALVADNFDPECPADIC